MLTTRRQLLVRQGEAAGRRRLRSAVVASLGCRITGSPCMTRVAVPSDRQILATLLENEVVDCRIPRHREGVRDTRGDSDHVARPNDDRVPHRDRASPSFTGGTVRTDDEAVPELECTGSRAHDDDVIPARMDLGVPNHSALADFAAPGLELRLDQRHQLRARLRRRSAAARR